MVNVCKPSCIVKLYSETFFVSRVDLNYFSDDHIKFGYDFRVDSIREQRRLEKKRRKEEHRRKLKAEQRKHAEEKAAAEAELELENRLKVKDTRPQVKDSSKEIEFTSLEVLDKISQDPRSPRFPPRASLYELHHEVPDGGPSLYEVREEPENKDSSNKAQVSRSYLYKVKATQPQEVPRSKAYVDPVLPADRQKLYQVEDVRLPQDVISHDEVFEPPYSVFEPAHKISHMHSSSTEEEFVLPPRDKAEEAVKSHHDTVDLHSSASDEGILTKESSTEELIDKEDLSHPPADGHESES